MKVSVQLQRLRGVRISRRELLDAPWYVGSLRTYRVGSSTKTLAVSLMGGYGITAPMSLLPALYDVQLVDIGNEWMILRGIEVINDAGMVQEWRCNTVK